MVCYSLPSYYILVSNILSSLLGTGHEGADECNFEFDVEAGEIDIDAV